jgi:hypothetical protein
MSGTPCFRGTRVPVQSLIDLLEGGETIEQFMKLYPPITREQNECDVFVTLDGSLEFQQNLNQASALTNKFSACILLSSVYGN